MARASLIPDVLDGIVTGLRAATGFRSPTSTSDGITVYDGPEFTARQGMDRSGFVVIGYGGEDLEQPDDGPNDPAVSTDTSVRAIATTSPKEHEDDIDCAAFYSLGSVDSSACRLAAFAIVDAVDTWLRANAKAGFTASGLNQVFHVQIVALEFQQYVAGGSRAVVRFTLRVKSRT